MSNDQQTTDFGTKSAHPVSAESSQVSKSTVAKSALDWTGKTVGEYLIESLVGAGGNGQVYRAVHRWLDLPVAVKLLSTVNANDTHAVDRFQREARIAARMHHPNIVRCTDGGVVGDQLFLVTDFVDGENARDLVNRMGWLPVADACEIVTQVAEALEYISESGTIHRDIKPSNIMVSPGGVVRVLDMGLARSSVTSHTLTETGQVMGTIDFMSPEQAVDTRHVDHRSDMYSLGCTFYYLLVGRAPFDSEQYDGVAAKLLAHLESDAPPIKAFRRDVPSALLKLIDQMMDKSADARPLSFRSVADLVRAHASGSRLSEKLLPTSHPTPRTPISDRSSNTLSRVGDSLGEASASVGKLVLCGIGVLDRHPPTRPGQKPLYTGSFRWLKGLTGLAVLAAALWFLGVRFLGIETVGEGYQIEVGSQGYGNSGRTFPTVTGAENGATDSGIRFNRFD